MNQRNRLLQELKGHFARRDDIAFSFLFGSYHRGTAHPQSDLDIAVYFYPEFCCPVEYEEDIYYDAEDDVWSDLEKLVNREVELLVLNRVSATVAATAIQGTPLLINDWRLYFDFMEVVTREAEDYTHMMSKMFLERFQLEKGI